MTVYEARSYSYSLGGGITLSPNALRILDGLQIFERVNDKGNHFDALSFVSGAGEVKDKYYFGSKELYGYSGFRIQRQVLLDEMKAMLDATSTQIHYNTKLIKVLKETVNEVTFELEGPEGPKVCSHGLAIGADGIHSTVRGHLFPDIKPIYSGFTAINSIVPRSSLRVPPGFPLPATVMGSTGAFLLVPQEVDGSQLLMGAQRRLEEKDRAGWEALAADKQRLKAMLSENIESWPDIVQSAIEGAPIDKMGIWPFYGIPPLPRWASEAGRVIIVGDAAHAIPPTAGQGVNQAFEDVNSLALLLAGTDKLAPALEFWQRFRQERVNKVLELTKQMNAKRLPPSEQAKLPAGAIWSDQSATCGEGGELKWLYNEDLDAVVKGWLAQN